MNPQKISLQQQITLCRHIAKLVQAKLPLLDHIAQFTDETRSDISQAGQRLHDKLAQGMSLTDSLIDDNSTDSRILKACLRVGQSCNCLDLALESWTALHISNHRFKKSLLTAMIYPVALVAISLISVGWTAWHLVPEIQSAYLQYNSQPPVWLRWIFVAREYFHWTSVVLVLAVTAPLAYWFHSRQRLDPFGVPENRSKRLRLQSLATQLAGWQIAADRPLSETLPLCLTAMGTSEDRSQTGFEDLRMHRPVAAMPIETTMVLASLHCGIIDQSQAVDHCQKISQRLSEQAELQDQQECRWLPIYVALVVGAVTLCSYCLLVYLPWIRLMTQVADSASLS